MADTSECLYICQLGLDLRQFDRLECMDKILTSRGRRTEKIPVSCDMPLYILLPRVVDGNAMRSNTTARNAACSNE